MTEHIKGYPVLVSLRLRNLGEPRSERIVVVDRGFGWPHRFVVWNRNDATDYCYWGAYTNSFSEAIETALHKYGFGDAMLTGRQKLDEIRHGISEYLDGRGYSEDLLELARLASPDPCPCGDPGDCHEAA